MAETASLESQLGVPPVGVSKGDDVLRLRILVVGHGYPPNQMAGAEQQMRRKVAWWQRHGHTVQVLAADPRLSNEIPFGQLESSSDEVDGVPVRRLRFAVADSTRALVDTYRHPLLEPELRRHVEEFQPDVIYQLSGTIFGLHPLEIAADYNIPSVLFATDFWHRCQRHTLLRPDGSCCPGPRHASDCASCRLTARRPVALLGPNVQKVSWSLLSALGRGAANLAHLRTPGVSAFDLREERIRRALAGVGLVVCNSQFLTDVFVDIGIGRERILTARQGLDDMPRIAATPDTDKQRTLRVLYLGQVTRHKGVDLLVDAVSCLLERGHDLELRIHGPVTDGVLKIDSGAGGRIRLGMSLSREQIAEAFAASDVLVVPSRWFENSPNVILEAQAMGVPVIAANHGGMAEMVRDDVDGLLFEPGSKVALEDALQRLSVDRDLLARLASNAPNPHPISVEMTLEDQAIRDLVRPKHRFATHAA
jgi:glycosyltransferase involved in cell wall biosynthesis